jgi:DNA gyrase subunit A
MDVGATGEVIAMDVARDDQELLVVTENGYGKRTRIDQYRKTARGAKGVKTIGLTENKGALGGALVVRGHQELVFISQEGMVQRVAARDISQQGRSATGVRVMNLREGDQVSAVALVVESDGETAAAVAEDVPDDPTATGPIDAVLDGPLGELGEDAPVDDDADPEPPAVDDAE